MTSSGRRGGDHDNGSAINDALSDRDRHVEPRETSPGSAAAEKLLDAECAEDCGAVPMPDDENAVGSLKEGAEEMAQPPCCEGKSAPCCDVSCLDRLALRACGDQKTKNTAGFEDSSSTSEPPSPRMIIRPARN